MEVLKYWKPETFEISSYKNSQKNMINKSYDMCGKDVTKKCTYTYNELGFRGDSITKDGFKIMSIGCSFTEGVGVTDGDTWSSQLSKLIPNGVDMNFGMGGRSNDYISRCLITYYDLIKPDLVLIMYTIPHRREIYTPDGGIEPYIPNASWGYMKETNDGRIRQQLITKAQNEYEDFNNWYRNHLLIHTFLNNKKCNWLWNGESIRYQYNDEFRFDGNYGTMLDYGVDDAHPGPLTNKQYAVDLFNYINEKYPTIF